MTLTIRHEPTSPATLTGADFSGNDGDTNRTYTLAYSNAREELFTLIISGAILQPNIHFSLANDIVTVFGALYNSQEITIDYFTGSGNILSLSGYGYCTTSDVYRTGGITNTEIPEVDVVDFIEEAEAHACEVTHYVYWKYNLEDQTTNSATGTSLTQTGAGWTANDFVGQYVYITEGTGSGQIRKVVTNTTDTLNVDRAWSTNPDTTSVWKLFYVPPKYNPYRQEHKDGNNQSYFFTRYTPLREVEQLVIGSTTVTPTNLYKYDLSGEIKFRSGAEASKFSASEPQNIHLKYWYGQEELPYEVKRLVMVTAAISTLQAQMGGTFDDPSTIGLPEFNISIGQAYINIEGTVRRLEEEYQKLIKLVKIQPIF